MQKLFSEGLSKVQKEMEEDPTYSLPQQQLPTIKKFEFYLTSFFLYFESYFLEPFIHWA